MIRIKKNITLVTLSSIVLCLAIVEAKTDREQSGLLGNVQSVVSKSSTEVEGTRELVTTTNYDLNGNTTMSEVDSYKIGDHASGRKLRSVYKNNYKARLVEVTSHWEDGSIDSKAVYTYDAASNKTGSFFFNSKGSLQYMVVQIYDTKGKNVAGITYLSDGTLRSKAVYNYDVKGNMVEMVSLKGDLSVEYKSKNSYDEEGHLKKTLIYGPKDSLIEGRVYTHDSKGSMTEMAIRNPDGSLRENETSSYDFDSVGNWIKQITQKRVSKGDRLEPDLPYIIRRTITYFEPK